MALNMESCSREEVAVRFGGTEKLLEELRDRLRDWLRLQPHLPQDVPEVLLENFILGTKMSLEQAKHKLDMYYTVRRLVPEIFTNRDPREPNLLNCHAMIEVAYLPKLTPEKYRICIFRPYVTDYSNCNTYDSPRYMAMLQDILMNDPDSRCLGYIFVFDHSSITLGLILKYPPAILKKCEVAAVEAYPMRIKGIHFVNASIVTETMVAVFKKVLKPKLASRIYSHSRGTYESLYQHVPKSILPKDYGGEERSISELAGLWRQKADDKRDWFLEQEKVLVNEQLRPGPAVNADDLFGFSGSFRKLEVD